MLTKEGIVLFEHGGSIYEDTWSKVDSVIKTYKELHKNDNEWKLWLKDVNRIRQTRKNEYSSNKDKSIRFGITIPPQLMFEIEVVEPDMFSNKKLFSRFMKHYPIFVIPEKI